MLFFQLMLLRHLQTALCFCSQIFQVFVLLENVHRVNLELLQLFEETEFWTSK